MALTYPYPLAFFSDVLRVKSARVRLQRFDEASGSGDGRTWTAELARPLWVADLNLADRQAALARELEAKIDGLDGSRGTFLFADPGYAGPASGTAGLGVVTVSGVRSDRGAIAVAGLPVGYVLTARDRLSIAYGGGRMYHGTFLEGGTAGSTGGLGQKEIRPHLPFGIAAGAAIELARPQFIASIVPGGYTPFEYDLPHGEIARGGSLRIQQKP